MTKATQPTFSLEQLNSVVAQAVAEALAQRDSKPQSGKTDYDQLAIKAFKKAGFGDNVPREDRRTYNGWLTEGLKVKPGEHAVKVRSLRLFHRSQCVALNAVERKAALQALEAKKAGKSSDKLPAVHLVEPVKPKGKASIVPIQPRA